MPRHLVLVGMMGSGKTTVGRVVAERLGRDFVDLDEVVEAEAGRTVAEVFAAEGEDGFRVRESAALAGALASPAPAVVATGGGVVLRPENRAALSSARVVWLRARPATLAARVGDAAGRPLLAGGEPEARLAALAGEREARYREVAHETVDVDGLSADEVVARVAEAVTR